MSDLDAELVTYERAVRRSRPGTVTVRQVAWVARHGTVPGYRRHRRHGEPACDLCLAANAAHSARTRQRAKADA